MTRREQELALLLKQRNKRESRAWRVAFPGDVSDALIEVSLDEFRHPADQIIVATARIHDCSLVTADDKIPKYGHVRTVAIG
jgi:PIN domain nuclease of toxin-antitoxin system